MSGELLRKTRAVNGLLQASAGRTLSLPALARALGENAECNTYIVDAAGKFLGHHRDLPCPSMREMAGDDAGFSPAYTQYLDGVAETRFNLPRKGSFCAFDPAVACRWDDILVTVVPVLGAGRRLGSVVLTRSGRGFSVADLLLAEYVATMAGMEIIRRLWGDRENAAYRRVVARAAADALSNAEAEAMRRIMPVLLIGPGVLVAGRVARQVGCTRSVVVNALHKLKSAGLIESRSQGMKGTYVKLLDQNLLEEIIRFEPRRRQGRGSAGRGKGEASSHPAAGEPRVGAGTGR
ncbi:MAG: GTP-sensing pleiotropic transcriptional regulator CodY [Peptococcaceae bacterium]|jgi:transcriptional pleiotropic repressor|nr:GTP-sensing pleiotropic transcriptional regulator CodY [Peptococcaceae bacterium]